MLQHALVLADIIALRNTAVHLANISLYLHDLEEEIVDGGLTTSFIFSRRYAFKSDSCCLAKITFYSKLALTILNQIARIAANR